MRFKAAAALFSVMICTLGRVAWSGTFTYIGVTIPNTEDDGTITGPIGANSNGDLLAESNVGLYLFKAASNYMIERLLNLEPIDGTLGYYLSGGASVLQGRIIGMNQGYYYSGVNGNIIDFGSAAAISPQIVHLFKKSYRGASPSGLTIGLHNRGYGTAIKGDTHDGFGTTGVAFFLQRVLDQIRYTSIFAFDGTTSIRGLPNGGRIAQLSDGDLVGLTMDSNSGQLYELHDTGTQWVGSALYNFASTTNGLYPVASNVVADAAGNVYTCLGGGLYGRGGVMQFTPPTRVNEPWQAHFLVQFGPRTYDPAVKDRCGLTLDSSTGQIIGLTDGGGQYSSGALFTVTPPDLAGQKWQMSIAHHFSGGGRDGAASGFAPLQIGPSFYGSSGKIVWGWRR